MAAEKKVTSTKKTTQKTAKPSSSVKPNKSKTKAKPKAAPTPKLTPAQKKEAELQAKLEWFLSLPDTDIKQLLESWNEKNLGVIKPADQSYDGWLNYFKKMPPNSIAKIAKIGMDTLSAEAYAALAMWHDIVQSPHRITKIHQAGLNKSRSAGKSIVELAQSNDQLALLYAVRDSMAEKLEAGAGARDTASLSRELTGIIDQIKDYERRLGPKQATALGRLLQDVELKKRPYKGGGARNTSFKTRVTTIEDAEAE